jgi:urea transport system substrate-binding protein
MKKPSIPLGLVISQSGPYAMMAGEMLKSAVMAIDEINTGDEFDFRFAPHLRDPGGVVAAYHTACADLIREEHVDNIVG